MLQPMATQDIASFKDYLADVLGVWDCYSRRWVRHAPIILRFENEDVLLQFESLDSTLPRASFRHGSESDFLDELYGDEVASSCLCWLRSNLYHHLIGEEVSVAEILEQIQQRNDA